MARGKSIRLLSIIGQDMNILPGNGETEDHYAERVILSAGAKWMLTAVHNEEEKVSVESIRKTAQEKIESYLEITDFQTAFDVQEIVNYIYDIMLTNGMFYHEQYNVRPIPAREIGIGGVSFIRGLRPEENVYFSSMAPYVPGGGEASLAEEFMLWNRNGEETLRSAWLHSSPQESRTEISEYLRVDHRELQTFYDRQRRDQAELTLGRTRKSDMQSYDYYMIRGKEIRRLTDNYVNAAIHSYAAIAIVNRQRKQKAVATISKRLVRLEMGYLLPKPDLRFLKYVAWPESLRELKRQGFRFSLQPHIWPIIKERLTFLGFAVEERYE